MNILTGNITLQGDISHTVTALTPIDTINYTASKWGYVTGTLTDQTDLVNALNLKADVSSLSTVATSGDYTDLSNKPNIPTKTSDLTNDSGFLTSAPVSSVDGKTGTVTVLPQGGTANQVLAKNSGTDYDVKWVNQSGGIEWATYGTTTYAEIDAFYNAGKTVRVLYNDVIYTLSVNALGSPNVYVFSAPSPSGNDFVYVQDDNVWRSMSALYGTYSMPLTGIPKTDLESAVQTSLGLADTALQSAPVSSVNGQTGTVTLSIPTKTSDLTNDSGFITSADDIYWCTYNTTTSAQIETALTNKKLPCVKYNDYIYTLRFRNSATNHRFVCNYGGKEKSIACQSGTWIPNADLTFLTSAPVTSVNGQTGAVTLSIPTKTSDLTNDSGFITSVPTEIFIATYGSNHYASIRSAYNNGKMVFAVYDGRIYSLATVSSETYPTYGFISSSGSTFYTLSCSTSNNGVSTNWFALSSSQVTSVNGQTGAVVISNATTSSAGLMSATDKTKLEAVYADYQSAINALGA